MKIKIENYITAHWGKRPLKIGDELINKCRVCGKGFSRIYNFKSCDDLEELDIKDAHKGCDKLAKKREKLKQQLRDVEYEVFARIMK